MGLAEFFKKMLKLTLSSKPPSNKNSTKIKRPTFKSTKRKKSVSKKVASKKTIKKKTVKKPTKKNQKKSKLLSKAKPTKAKLAKRKPIEAKSKEKEIGHITHYFGKISVGIIKLKAELKVGDNIHIKGVHDDFVQEIKSMQINRNDVLRAGKGDEVGVKVKRIVHENDKVFI